MRRGQAHHFCALTVWQGNRHSRSKTIRILREVVYPHVGHIESGFRGVPDKSKSILGAAKKVIEDYGGKVPKTMEELITLPTRFLSVISQPTEEG